MRLRQGRVNIAERVMGQGVEMGTLMPQLEEAVPGHVFPGQNPEAATVALATRTPKLKLVDPTKVFERIIDKDLGKEDIVVPWKDLSFGAMNSMSIKDHGTFMFDDKYPAFDQLCARLNIPAAYLRKCPVTGRAGRQEQLEYWRDTVDENDVMLRVKGFDSEKGGARGVLRAVLGKAYEPVDNVRVFGWTAEAIEQTPGLGLIYANVNDQTSHFRVAFQEPIDLGTLDKPDPHYFGVHIADSEVGGRALTMDYMMYRLACLNGLIVEVEGEKLLHQRHINIDMNALGRNFKEAFQVALDYKELLSDTLQASRNQIVRDPETMIRRVVRQYRGTKEFADAIVQAYLDDETMRDQQATRFSVVQAITRAARRMPIDRRYDVETMAGQFLVNAA